jgi:glycosyltransferase involved in cell wall biosynthesis
MFGLGNAWYDLGMTASLVVWLLNPYHTGSHRAWAEGYARHSRHAVRILDMQGNFWKWRMQGASLELAEQALTRVHAGERPDVLMATSMTNLPAFFGLTRRTLGNVPTVLYMHENQLTYPPPPGTKRDLAYGMIQHLSMLAADRVCFNSAYHLASWFAEAPRLLKHFPDYVHLESIDAARARARVLPVGCRLADLDAYGPRPALSGPPPDSSEPPLILWNQRWEYDKAPETMLRALYALADEGASFRVALAGENLRVRPDEFSEARARLGERLVHYGYAAAHGDYARLLWSADIVLSTALHEFFGVSIVEAIYCGSQPILPARLSYPELLPPELHAACLYRNDAELLDRLRAALAAPRADPRLRGFVSRFDWPAQAPAYDALMAEAASAQP